MKAFRVFAFAFLIIPALFTLTSSTAFASVTWTNETTGTSASGQNWYSITSSADGTHLAAVAAGGDIWTSTNSGVTWTNETTGTSASGQNWYSITSSADGAHLAAVANGADIWTSSNSGVTWTNETTGTSASGQNWYSITSSADGAHLAAVTYGGDIWTSTNSGVTWTNETTGTSASGQGWDSITSSADGAHLAAVTYGGDIWTSSNSGVTWTNETTGTSASGQEWDTITSSADGAHLAAVAIVPDIWTSSNSGVTWTNETTGTSASGQRWYSITSSADGTHLAAVANGADIWTSSNSGVTWTNETTGTSASGQEWDSITSSADGTHLAAVTNGADIWTGIIPTAPKIVHIDQSNTVALSKGLVGYWTFDGPSINWATGVVKDMSGNANNGQLIGMSTSSSPTIGKIGQALSFNGSNAVIAGANPVTGSSPFTIAAWLKNGSTSNYEIAAMIGNCNVTGNQGAYIGYVTTAQVGTNNSIGGAIYGTNYGSGVRGSNWHDVVVTYAGGTLGAVTLYVDGLKTTSGTATMGLTSTTVKMGNCNTGPSFPFTGSLDDFRLYNRALSTQEIWQLYSMGKVTLTPGMGKVTLNQ